MGCIRTAGLILAAGRSSRLGGVKPLLPLGKSKIIQAGVEKLSCCCSEIAVVMGRNAEEVGEALIPYRNVKTIYNEDFETAPMFSSVLLGMEYLADRSERLFLMPCDTPAFREHTLKVMIKYMNVTAAKAVKPAFNGISGHPVLIDISLCHLILDYNGENGLAGAIEAAGGARTVAVPDYGILLDTDTPQDYEKLLQYHQNREIPTPGECEAILDFMRVPQNIRAHGRAVAERAVKIAGKLVTAGYALDCKLIYSAALLHDICRRESNHAKRGAQALRQMGFEKTAHAVSLHMDIIDTEKLDEPAIVMCRLMSAKKS